MLFFFLFPFSPSIPAGFWVIRVSNGGRGNLFALKKTFYFLIFGFLPVFFLLVVFDSGGKSMQLGKIPKTPQRGIFSMGFI